VKLYRKACEHHNVYGCANLGWFTYKGIGTTADKVKGKELLTQACNLKNQWACERGERSESSRTQLRTTP